MPQPNKNWWEDDTPFAQDTQAKGKAETAPWWEDDMPFAPKEKEEGIGFQDVLEGANALSQTLKRVPENLAAKAIMGIQGKSGASVADRGVADRFVNWIDDRNRKLAEKYEGKGPIAKETVQFGPNLAFSGVSMGASIAGGAATAPIPIPGARIAGATAGGAVAAYRMSGYEVMNNYLKKVNKESIAKGLGPLSKEKEEEFKDTVDGLATEYGLWEAGGEGISNVIELAFMTAKNLPGVKWVPKKLAGKAVKSALRLAGILGTEEVGETITGMGQQPVESKLGLTDEAPKEWTSADDWIDTAKEVLPQVLMLTGAMHAGGAAYRQATGKNKDPFQRDVDPTIDISGQFKDQKIKEFFNEVNEKFGLPITDTGGRITKLPPEIEQEAIDNLTQGLLNKDIDLVRGKQIAEHLIMQNPKLEKSLGNIIVAREIVDNVKQVIDLTDIVKAPGMLPAVKKGLEGVKPMLEETPQQEDIIDMEEIQDPDWIPGEGLKEDEPYGLQRRLTEGEVPKEAPLNELPTGEEAITLGDGVKPTRIDEPPTLPPDKGKGEPVPPGVDNVEDVGVVERREDLELRKRIDQMTPEEMQRELLTDNLTGIGNQRSFEETERLPQQTSIDVDSLKWVNDNLGHEAGDDLLKSVGEALDQASDKPAYRLHGDEFWFEGETKEEIALAMSSANDYLKNNPIVGKKPDGTLVNFTGGFSYGTGETAATAEEQLQADKAARELEGKRAERGEQPPGLVERGPEGDRVKPGREGDSDEVIPPKIPDQTTLDTRQREYDNAVQILAKDPDSTTKQALVEQSKQKLIDAGGVVGEVDFYPATKEYEKFRADMKEKYGPDPFFKTTPEETKKDSTLIVKAREEILSQYKKDYPNVPIVLTKPDGKRGVIIAKSTKHKGQYQITDWDERGFIGDRTYKTEMEAIEDAWVGNARTPNPKTFEEISQTKQFTEGIKETEKAQIAWAGQLKSEAGKKKAPEQVKTPTDIAREGEGEPYTYGGLGYKVTQAKKAKKDAQTKWTIDISDDLRISLEAEMGILESGEPGGKIRTGEGLDEKWIGQKSSYPQWFKDQGWTKVSALNAIKKALTNKPLGVKQAQIVESALDSINEQYYNEYAEVLKNAGYTEGQIEKAARTGLAEEVERVEAEIERLEREGKKGKYDQDAIDDLDWMFKEQQSLFGPQPETPLLKPEELTKKERLARAQDEAKRKGLTKKGKKPVFQSDKGVKPANVGKQQDLFGAKQGDLFNQGIETPNNEQVVYETAKPKEIKLTKAKEGRSLPGATRVRYRTSGRIRAQSNVVTNNEDLASLLARLRTEPDEYFYSVAVDKNGVILEIHEHSKGGRSAGAVFPDIVVGRAIQIPGVAKVYFAHNHPSYSTRNSNEDAAITKDLNRLLAIAGMPTQSIIIGGKKYAGLTSSGVGATHRIKPVLRKTLLKKVKRRTARAFNPQDEILKSDHAQAYFKNMLNNEDGVLLMTRQNNPVAFLPFVKGRTMRQTSADLLKLAEQTNGASIVIKDDTGSNVRRKFIEGLVSEPLGGLGVLDIIDNERSWSDGQLPGMYSKGSLTPEGRDARLGSQTRLSVAPTKAKGLPLKTVQTIVNGIYNQLTIPGVKVNVLPGVENLGPDRMKRFDIDPDKQTVRGVFTQEDGKPVIYLFANAMNSKRDVVNVALEEAFHYGIFKTLGKDYRNTLNKVYTANEKAIKETLGSDYDLDLNTQEGRVEAVDEWISKSIVNETLPQTVWRKIVAAVRKMLRKAGIKFDLSAAEIKGMVVNAVTRGAPDTGGTVATRKQGRTYAEPFHSQLIKAVQDNIKEMPAKVQSLTKWLQKKQVKPAELKWMGTEQWLKDNQKDGKIDRDAFLEFLKSNDIEVREVVKGEGKVSKEYLDDLRETSLDKAREYGEQFDEVIDDSGNETDAEGRPILLYKNGRTEITLTISVAGDGWSVFEETDEVFSEPEVVLGEEERPESSTKFSQYQLPGGERYREMLFVLPTPVAERKRLAKLDSERPLTSEEEDRYQELQKTTMGLETYQSQHWDEPNVLAHVRWNERTDSEGNRVLFLEEIQSDWLQDAKEKGFKGLSEAEKQRKEELERHSIGEWSSKDTDWYNAVVNDRESYGVPKAPFLENWHEYTLKRMLRYAAQNGFDKVAFTKGSHQIDRYNEAMRQNVDELRWERTPQHDTTFPKGSVRIIASRGGSDVFNNIVPLTGTSTISGKDVTLKDVVGKPIAQQIVASKDTSGTVKGDDLSIGGMGMRSFYDELLPGFLKKYGKQWGATTGISEIDVGAPLEGDNRVFTKNAKVEAVPIRSGEKEGQYFIIIQDGENYKTLVEDSYDTKEEAIQVGEKWLDSVLKSATTESVHSIEVTPEMRESVLFEGQTRFAKTPIVKDGEGTSFSVEMPKKDLDQWADDYLKQFISAQPEAKREAVEKKVKKEEKTFDKEHPKDAVALWDTIKNITKIKMVKGKTDFKSWERLLSVPAHFFHRVAAMGRVFNDGLQNTDNRHIILDEITMANDGHYYTVELDTFRKQDKAGYRKLTKYLKKRDQNGIGYSIAKNLDGGWDLYGVKDHKTPIATFISGTIDAETQAVEAMIQAEANDYRKAGASDQAVNSLIGARRITNNGFNILFQALRDLESHYKELKMEMPTETVNVDGKAVSVNLKLALAKMGSIRGFYMPRVRPPGKFVVLAQKKGSHPLRKHFDVKTIARGWASRKEGQGYTTTFKQQKKMPEDVFEMAGQVIAQEAIINEALQRIRTNKFELKDFGLTPVDRSWGPGKRDFMVTGPAPKTLTPLFKRMGGKWYSSEGQGKGGPKVWHFQNPGSYFETRLAKAIAFEQAAVDVDTQTKAVFAKALVEQVSNIIKGRGVRAHMIQRADAKGIDVWEGYEEDPGIALAKYAKGVSAGEAKKIMARDMLAHFTGTDISWKQFQALEGEDTTYENYLDFVEERRVDPVNQENAFKEGKSYMEHMLRNEEAIDRLTGTIKGIAVLKYLGGRVSAPLINLTAMVTSVPAAMEGFGKIPIHKTFGHIVKAGKLYGTYKFGNVKSLPADIKLLFDEIHNKGWHNAQYNREALAVLRGKAGRGWDKLIDWSMLGFGITEQLNRVSTIAGAYLGLKEQGRTDHDEMLALAKKISDQSHATYGKANYPSIARGSHPAANVMKAFYVFKTFSHNYMLTMKDLWGAGWTPKHGKAFSYMALSPAVLAGAGGVVGFDLIMKAIGMAFDLDDPEDDMYKWLEANVGDYAENMARFGGFGLIGMNLKGSLEIGVTDLPTSWKDVLGAPGSVIMDFYDGGKNLMQGNISKGIEKISPLAVGAPFKAYREATEGLTTRTNAPIFYGKDRVKADMTDAILRGLSFNPAAIAKIREEKWAERKQEQAWRDRKTKINSQIKKFMLQPTEDRTKADWADILEDVREYNERIKRKKLVGIIPYITWKTIRRDIRRSFKPTKREIRRRNQ